jgi:inhibitor of cysteine peptidase
MLLSEAWRSIMPTLTLTPAQSGQPVQVEQGTGVAIRLPENPTTGYRWSHDVNDEAFVVESTGSSPSPGGGIGSGGERTFMLQAKATGTFHLRFKLWREWEGDKSVIQRVDFPIQVT